MKRILTILTAVAATVVASAALLTPGPAVAATDRTPPTTPANLRGEYANGVLTAITWDPSVFNGGVSYVLSAGDTVLSSTSHTRVTVHDLVHVECSVSPGGTYTMTVQAIGTDNYLSGVSAPLTVTIPQTVPVR